MGLETTEQTPFLLSEVSIFIMAAEPSFFFYWLSEFGNIYSGKNGIFSRSYGHAMVVTDHNNRSNGVGW